MTQVYLHPSVDDHFVEFDMAEVRASIADGGNDDLRRRIVEAYASEKIVLLRNTAIKYDREFIRSIAFPQTWRFKKFPCRTVEAPTQLADDPAKQEVAQALFGGDAAAYSYFEQQMRAVNGGIRDVLDDILCHHRVNKRDISWRHTETRVENLHFDIDKGAAEFESVRLYYNMDDAPRIWHTTHCLTDLLATYYDELQLAQFSAEPLEQLLHALSFRVFGNWWSRGREQFPRHAVLFEPDDLWLADGRTVPHQVFYGRRTAATFYRLPLEGLPAWHPSLAAKIKKIHDEQGVDGRKAKDTQGYRYPFGLDGPPHPAGIEPPLDLKGEWSEIYHQSISGGLVRL